MITAADIDFIKKVPKHPMLGVENLGTLTPDGRVIQFLVDGSTKVEKSKGTAEYYQGPNWN